MASTPRKMKRSENVDHVDGLSCVRRGSPDTRGSTVDGVEHAELPAIVGAVLDEVVGPDVIALLRPQPDARSVGEPMPAFEAVVGTFRPSRRRDRSTRLSLTCHPGIPQQRSDLAVAIAAVLSRKGDDVGRQPLRVLWAPRDLTLCRATPKRRTSAALGDTETEPDMPTQARRRAGLTSFCGSLLQNELIKASNRGQPREVSCALSRDPSNRFT